jgi:hypothetical protein
MIGMSFLKVAYRSFAPIHLAASAYFNTFLKKQMMGFRSKAFRNPKSTFRNPKSYFIFRPIFGALTIAHKTIFIKLS